MSKKKRIHAPIWELIKKNNKAFVKCKHAAQTRVIKAVQKEKYMDEEKFEFVGQLETIRHPHGVEFYILGKLKAEDF